MTNHETNTSATIFGTYNVPRSFEREWLLSHDYAETPDYGKLPAPNKDCDICYGTGYQPTCAGVKLLGFLRRQKKRMEREEGK